MEWHLNDDPLLINSTQVFPSFLMPQANGYSGVEWFQIAWAGPITSSHITVKELVPIVLAAAVWGDQWKGKTVRAECDNEAVVAIINQGNQEVMHLMRCLAFVAAKFQFYLFATHIKGVNNTLADALS